MVFGPVAGLRFFRDPVAASLETYLGSSAQGDQDVPVLFGVLVKLLAAESLGGDAASGSLLDGRSDGGHGYQARRQNPALDRHEASLSDIRVDGLDKRAFAGPGAELMGHRLGIENQVESLWASACAMAALAELGRAFAVAQLVEQIVEFGARIAPAEDVCALVDETARRGDAQKPGEAREHRASRDARGPAHAMTFLRWSARRSVSASEFMVGLEAL